MKDKRESFLVEELVACLVMNVVGVGELNISSSYFLFPHTLVEGTNNARSKFCTKSDNLFPCRGLDMLTHSSFYY